MHFLKTSLGFYDCFALSCNGHKGGLCLLWRTNLKISVLVANQSLLHVYIEPVNNSQPWLFTGIYGPPNPQARKNLWNDFNSIVPSHNHPWLLMGDFNEILNQMEKKGGKTGMHQSRKQAERSNQQQWAHRSGISWRPVHLE